MATKGGSVTIDSLRQLPDNKKCFDCMQKGTMYAVMNFGVFVCSTCAGTHREINNKVKGLSMCTFSEAELKNLAQNGNLTQQSILLAKWKPKKDQEPDKKDPFKLKEFLKAKYINKQWAVAEEDSDSEVSSDEEERRKQKKKKKKEAAKKKAASTKSKAQASKAASSDEDSDYGEEKKVEVTTKSRRGKLMQPPGFKQVQPNVTNEKKTEEKPKEINKKVLQEKKPEQVQQTQPIQSIDLLDFGASVSAPVVQQAPAATESEDWGSWGNFEDAPAQVQNTQTQPQQNTANSLLEMNGDIFAQPAPQVQQNQQAQNQNGFKPMAMVNGTNVQQPIQAQQQQPKPQGTSAGDPFQNIMNAYGNTPQQQMMPQQQFNSQQMGGQPMNQQQMMQQMAALQAQMQNMQVNGSGQNANPNMMPNGPMQMQQMQMQMQGMMSQMQNMMGNNQQQQQINPNMVTQQQQPTAQVPQKQEEIPTKLTGIFNDMNSGAISFQQQQKQTQAPAQMQQQNQNPFGTAPQQNTQNANNNFNPFDI